MQTSDDRTDPRSRLVGVALVLAAAGLFAVNGTVSKLVLQSGLSSLHLVEIRCAAAAAVLVVLVLLRAPRALRVRRRDLGFLALYGIVGIAMVQWLYYVAIGRLPVSVALLVEFTAPLLVALWVRFVRREAVHRRVWWALALVLAGLALVARVWQGLTLDGLGLVAAVAAAASLAAYYLLGARGLTRHDPLPLAALSFTAAAAFWSVLLPWWEFPFGRLAGTATVPDGGPAVPVALLVAWVVLLGTVVPFLLNLAGLRRVGPTRAGLLGTVEPPAAGVVALVVLGEALAPVQVVGGLLVLAGIVVVELARSAATPPAPAGEVPVTAGR